MVVVIVLLVRKMSRKLVVLMLWRTISRAYRGRRCRIGPVTDEVALNQQPAADEVALCLRDLLLYLQKLSQWSSVYDMTEAVESEPQRLFALMPPTMLHWSCPYFVIASISVEVELHRCSFVDAADKDVS